jgi:malate dehydrogenase
LGAAIARKLADRGRAARVVLVDLDLGMARGKALDLLQSGPVEGSDTHVEACAELAEAGPVDAVVVADAPAGAELARRLVPLLGDAILVVARSDAPACIEAAVASGLPRARAVGSAPVALAGALRRRLAEELKAAPREVGAIVLGLPPDVLVLPRESATLGGIPIDRLSALACRRGLEGIRGRTLGPVALAAAAVRVLQALAGFRATVLPVFVRLDGEYGHRGVALAVPARLGHGVVEAVVEFPLDPVDRVAMDGAAQRRFEAG